MTKQKALREAQRRWGKKAAVEDRGYETSDELRSAASNKLQELRALPKIEYKSDEAKERRRQINKLGSEACRKRCSVGEIDGLCGLGMFFVHGQGDTFELAFAEADKLVASMKKKAA